MVLAYDQHGTARLNIDDITQLKHQHSLPQRTVHCPDIAYSGSPRCGDRDCHGTGGVTVSGTATFTYYKQQFCDRTQLTTPSHGTMPSLPARQFSRSGGGVCVSRLSMYI